MKRYLGLKRPMRGRGSLPPWAWRQGRGPSPLLAAPIPPPWGFSPTWGKGRGWSPSLAYIRRGGGAFFNTTLSFSLSLSLSLSLFLRPRVDSPSLEFAPGWGFHHQSDAVALPESGSGSIFFPLLFWFGARRDVGCTVRV